MHFCVKETNSKFVQMTMNDEQFGSLTIQHCYDIIYMIVKF